MNEIPSTRLPEAARNPEDYPYSLAGGNKAWANGSVKGMKARSAFVVDMAWEETKLKQAAILSGKGAVCRFKTSGPVTVTHKENAVNVTKHDDGSISFPTESGESYSVVAR